MASRRNRLLAERAEVEEQAPRAAKAGPGAGGRARTRAARSVTVNLAESPLGWLFSRGMVDKRQFEAGERIRADWECAQLPPSVTMKWDAPPNGKVARGAPLGLDPSLAQIAAKRRFEAAVEEVGGGLSDILWRIVCAGEGMREAETALGWPARAGRLVLSLALDRLADHYRIR
jgi:hypothetical protein